MALQMVRNFTVQNGQYTNLITANNPLTIEQDGSIDDINLIPATTFHVFNDGRRRDPVFDPAEGTIMLLRYTGQTIGGKIRVAPIPFNTTVRSGVAHSLGTSRIYLTETSRTVPGGSGMLQINVGTVLRFHVGGTLSGGEVINPTASEEVLVRRISGDATGSFVEVVRNYRGSSTTGTTLDIIGNSHVVASTRHIFLSLNPTTFPTQGGQPVELEDFSNEILTPVVSPASSLFQTIHIKAVPQLNRSVATNNPNFVGRIPTQFKTDVYFEISYRELPR